MAFESHALCKTNTFGALFSRNKANSISNLINSRTNSHLNQEIPIFKKNMLKRFRPPFPYPHQGNANQTQHFFQYCSSSKLSKKHETKTNFIHVVPFFIANLCFHFPTFEMADCTIFALSVGRLVSPLIFLLLLNN